MVVVEGGVTAYHFRNARSFRLGYIATHVFSGSED